MNTFLGKTVIKHFRTRLFAISLKLLFNPIITRSLSPRLCSTETLKPTFDIPQKLKKAKDQQSDSTHGFETLLRNSTFTQMGDPVGKVCNFKNKLLST